MQCQIGVTRHYLRNYVVSVEDCDHGFPIRDMKLSTVTTLAGFPPVYMYCLRAALK